MTCIDHSSRPSRLLVAAAVLLSTTLSLPASAAAPTADHTKVWKRKRSNRRYLQFTTTENSADDAFDSYKLLQQTGLNATVSSSSITQTKNNKGELICTPVEECELCPLKWKQLLDQDDEKVKGEFKSCTKYERRQRFECTALMQGEYYYLMCIIPLYPCFRCLFLSSTQILLYTTPQKTMKSLKQ